MAEQRVELYTGGAPAGQQALWYAGAKRIAMIVNCPACGAASPPGKRFCGDCGAPLPTPCPSCGADNPPGKRFCGDCGSPLPGTPPLVSTPAAASAVLAPPGPSPPTGSAPAALLPPTGEPELERRLATILFADLVDSTRLAAALDPEDWHAALAAAHAALAETVTQFGGYVAQYLGDGLLALFGAPTAHEDDAERAVLAGLRMHRALAAVNDARPPTLPALRLRVGLATGEVVTGLMGNAYGVRGDAANTAARIQGAAEPGGVLVDAATMHLAQRRVRFGERQDLTLKGKAEPVAASPALAARETLVERWELREQRTPLVGRARELEQVHAAWQRAQGGEGQLLTVIGEAGVGKSRLVAEALERIMAAGEVRVLRARALSHGQQMSLWLVADLLRALCGLREQDPLEEVRTRLRATLTALLAAQDAETRASATDVLGEVLGLPIGASLVANAGAQARRHWVIRSLRLLLGALSVRGPVVLALEDLHWSDEGSAAVLADVLADVPGLRVLVLASQRPGWSASWGEWGWTERLTLHSLGDADGRRLAEAVLGGVQLAPDLERHVAERAGGNPFFVEELLRSLQEAGDLVVHEGQVALAPGAAERLPATLTEVLLARLDRLEAEVRSLTQVASVLGRTFAVRLLAQVVRQDVARLEPLLGALQRAEIVFPRPSEEPEYIFKHATLREVAYHTLVQRRRQALHLTAARAIAELYPADEYVEVIAYHYSKTEEHTEAASWLERAGDYAARIYANEAAIGHLTQARRHYEMSGADALTLAGLDEKLGALYLSTARYAEALAALELAAQAYQVAGDREAEGRTTAQIGRAYARRGMPQEGLARIRPVLERLDGGGPMSGLAALYVAQAHLYSANDQPHKAITAAERASALASALGDDVILGQSETVRGSSLSYLGRVSEALPVLEEAISLTEASGEVYGQCSVLNETARLYAFLGEFATAAPYIERAMALAERAGEREWIAFLHFHLGFNAYYTGDWPRARRHGEQAAAMFRDIGGQMSAGYGLFLLGMVACGEGQWGAATGYLDQAVRLQESTTFHEGLRIAQSLLAEIEIHQGRAAAARDRLLPLIEKPRGKVGLVTFMIPKVAWAYLELGEFDAAARVADEAVALAQAKSDRLSLVESLRVQAMVAIRQEQWEEATTALEDGITMAQKMPYPYAEARLLHVYGDLHLQMGAPGLARERLEAALAILQRLGARKDAERVAQAIAALAPSA